MIQQHAMTAPIIEPLIKTMECNAGSPNISQIPSVAEDGGSRVRHFFDLSEQEVQSIAQQIALEFSNAPEFLEGVRRLFNCGYDLTAEELERDAMMFLFNSRLSYHRCYEPLIAIEESLSQFIDPSRLASVLRLIWQSDNVGFNLLSGPAGKSLDNYVFEADYLLNDLTDSGGFGPERLLTNTVDGRDLDFWHSLPRKFTVYRGAYGVTAEQCAAGVCWTTKREIAEWFALRAFSDGDPVLVSARIFKSQVSTIFAKEYEIAVRPDCFKELKIKRRSGGHFPEDGEWDGEVTSRRYRRGQRE